MKTIGVVGLGSIGSRHAANLIALGHEVIGHELAIIDRAAVPLAPMTEMLAQCDAVVIASPTHCHAEHIRAAKAEGVPIFVEKPIAHEYDATFASVDMVGFNLRFHSCVIKAKEWVEAGDIGTPFWASFTIAQHSAKPAYLRDGVISNWASHEIDLALYLLGPASVCSAATIDSEGRDILADIVLRHRSGWQTTVHADYVTRPEIRQSVIVGDRGTIIMDLVHRQAWLRDIDGHVIDHLVGADTFDDNYLAEMRAFLDRIDGKSTIGATGADGLAVLTICQNARAAAGLT